MVDRGHRLAVKPLGSGLRQRFSQHASAWTERRCLPIQNACWDDSELTTAGKNRLADRTATLAIDRAALMDRAHIGCHMNQALGASLPQVFEYSCRFLFSLFDALTEQEIGRPQKRGGQVQNSSPQRDLR